MKRFDLRHLKNDFYARMQCEQTTLHGDPALKLDASFAKPDYVIEDQLLKINPTFISVAENSFNVKAKFMNLGKAINKNIVIEIKRTYPDLTTEVVRRDTIPGIRYIDSLSYDLPIISFRDKKFVIFCAFYMRAIKKSHFINFLNTFIYEFSYFFSS